MSVPVSLAQQQMPQLLPEFLARYPQVRVQMHVSNRRVDVINEGFDVADNPLTPEDETVNSDRVEEEAISLLIERLHPEELRRLVDRAVAPIANPSGFSFAIPSACCAPCFTSPLLGVPPVNVDFTLSTLIAGLATLIIWTNAHSFASLIVFSILGDEWAGVKAGLRARLRV